MYGYLFPLLATTSSKTQPSHALSTSKSFYRSPAMSYLFSISVMHNMHIWAKTELQFQKKKKKYETTMYSVGGSHVEIWAGLGPTFMAAQSAGL